MSESDFELALEAIEDMLEVEPDNEKHWNSKGIVLAKLGRLEGSISAFDRSLEIDPGVPKTWYSKGVVLMDNGKVRAALGCFYKTLDLDPAFDKARERFLKCLDEMALQKQVTVSEVEETQEKWISGPGEPMEEKEAPVDEMEEEIAPPPPRKKRRKGSYLDEDMFMEEEEEEDWEEFDEEEMEEEWEELDEEEEEEEHPFLTCRCGNRIPITSEKRPFRFVCDECGRSGTLR
ncbi:MAG: tetratricopeptide repeat protein [Thermoplasmatota archaeon]